MRSVGISLRKALFGTGIGSRRARFVPGDGGEDASKCGCADSVQLLEQFPVKIQFPETGQVAGSEDKDGLEAFCSRVIEGFGDDADGFFNFCSIDGAPLSISRLALGAEGGVVHRADEGFAVEACYLFHLV